MLNWYRTVFEHLEQFGHCRILADHFNEGATKSASYSAHILEKVVAELKEKQLMLKTFFKKNRETLWMLQLKTVP